MTNPKNQVNRAFQERLAVMWAMHPDTDDLTLLEVAGKFFQVAASRVLNFPPPKECKPDDIMYGVMLGGTFMGDPYTDEAKAREHAKQYGAQAFVLKLKVVARGV